MRYAYMTIRTNGASVCFNFREASKDALAVYRVSYGYSKDVHHHWDVPTFRLVGDRLF
jgi:hypothetical protein